MNQFTALVGEAPAPSEIDEADLAALRESIATVVDAQCGSIALHAHVDGEARLDDTLWRLATDLGWLAIGIPEDHGGLGLGLRGLDVLHRELGRRAAPGPFLPTLAAGQALLASTDDAVRTQWLPGLAAGEISAAIPLTLDGAGSMRLLGGKLVGSATLLGAPQAAIALLPIDDGRWALAELAGARVDPAPFWDKTREIVDAAFDGAAPLALLEDGPAIERALHEAMCLAVAADSVGGTRGLLDLTIAYMKDRVQFGRPVASFQALKHRIADMTAMVAVNEHLVAQGLDLAASGLDGADLWSSLAKSEASEAYAMIAGECLQLHGGVGFTWEFDPHIYLKRARLNETLAGANTTLRDRAAAGLAAASRAGHTTMELSLS
jgi:alkylation response protein AidB-like acyl-CoA dehydrogenase